MDNINIVWNNLGKIAITNDIIKIFFIGICTYLSFLKIINNKKINIKKHIISLFCIFIVSVISIIAKYKLNFLMYVVTLSFLLSWICAISSENSIGYSILITIISLSFNYVIFVITIMFVFIFNIAVYAIENDYINLILMICLHISIIYFFSKTKRIKNGIVFLQNDSNNNKYLDIIILNISICILFSIVVFSNIDIVFSRSLFIAFIIFSIIMFITIQKSLQLYYKQKLLEQDLKETKEELEKKKEEIKKLEEENLNFSKTSHSLAHKQKSLEYKLEQIMQRNEIAEEIEIRDSINNISKELYNTIIEVELTKTGITEIDDMFKYMQSECIKNKINFQLQIKGNIHEMINNYISKEDLSILIADHVKNAIIAINNSNNINKNILVRLGNIDNIYSLYIYDSGIEFKNETLSNLGIKPSTTHADSGGTGMGFMNTFDTLKKYNASLIINEYNEPNKDNFTKSLMIKFNKKLEFKINSYKYLQK